MNAGIPRRKLVTVLAGIAILAFVALTAYPVMRWSAEDNLSECAYETEKLLVHILRVVLLADGETVHNAFFDRRFAP